MKLQTLLFFTVCAICTNCSLQPLSSNQSNPVNSSMADVAIPTIVSPTLDYKSVCYQHYLKANELAPSVEAITEYELAVASGCDTVNLRHDFGANFYALKRYDEAAEQYCLAIQHDSKSWADHWTLAALYILYLGKYEEGLKEIKISRQLDSLRELNYVYDYYEARAFEGLGKYEEALKHYDVYIKNETKVAERDEKLLDAKERVRSIKEKQQ